MQIATGSIFVGWLALSAILHPIRLVQAGKERKGGDEVESIEVDVSGVHSSVGVGLHSSVRTLFDFSLVSGFCCG